MSDQSNTGPKSDLLSWRKTGLTGASAQVLFQIVRLYREQNRPITLTEIVTALTDKDSRFKSKIKRGSIRTTAARFKKLKWSSESQPYVIGGWDSYEPVEEVFITNPRTAKLVLAIHAAPAGRIVREDFLREAERDHHWLKADLLPDQYIQLLVDRRYCVLNGEFIATTSCGEGRFVKERGYLELLAGLDSGRDLHDSKAPEHIGNAGRTPDKLEADHVDIIMTAWRKRWTARTADHDVAKDRISVNCEQIAAELKAKSRPKAEGEIQALIGEIDRYQRRYGWVTVSINGNEIRYALNSAIMYPETAHFILFIYDHPKTSEALQEAKSKYPGTFTESLEWCTFPGIEYLKTHPVSTVQYAVTPRVEAEELYLRAIAQYYDPSIKLRRRSNVSKRTPRSQKSTAGARKTAGPRIDNSKPNPRKQKRKKK